LAAGSRKFSTSLSRVKYEHLPQNFPPALLTPAQMWVVLKVLFLLRQNNLFCSVKKSVFIVIPFACMQCRTKTIKTKVGLE
jgi:hypothetical protein